MALAYPCVTSNKGSKMSRTLSIYDNRALCSQQSKQPRLLVRCAAFSKRKQRQKDSPVVVGLVSAMTESLRLLGVGKKQYEDVITTGPSESEDLQPGDVAGVISHIAADFKQGYIITGIITDKIYDKDCYFADPTVSFSGLRLWKRNLQLLVPFLIDPYLGLNSITPTGKDEDGSETIKAEWELRTYLSLPWRPLISIQGTTDYTLDAAANKVVSHVESWDVSGAQALAQMLRPSDRSLWGQGQGR